MKKIIFGLLFFGLTTQMFAQIIELTEVEIKEKYQYLDAIDNPESAIPVKLLSNSAVNYVITSEEIFNDDCGNQKVFFEIPDGKLVAVFDENGKIVRTIEKYKNVRLPQDVLQAIAKRFPNWAIVEDVYLVNYHCETGMKHVYKIKIQNEDKTVSVKTDEKGNFI